MRTTLDIDDDALEVARDIAHAEGRSLGAVVSDLIRRGLTTPSIAGQPGLAETPAAFVGQWPTFPGRPGMPVTPALVQRIERALDREDAEAFDHDADQPR